VDLDWDSADALGFVEVEMKSSGYVTLSADLKNPRFGKVAEAMRINAEIPTMATTSRPVPTWLA